MISFPAVNIVIVLVLGAYSFHGSIYYKPKPTMIQEGISCIFVELMTVKRVLFAS